MLPPSVSEGPDLPTGMGRPRGPCVAERVGFEPTVLSHTAFRERHHQPLGHLSVREGSSDALPDRSGGPVNQRVEAA